jgi:transcriptional regulator with XRE-family HTH domain
MSGVCEMTLDPERLKYLRSEAGLTQQQLAERSGISIASLMALEQGRNPNPRLDTLRKLAAALGCTVGRMVDDPEPPQRGRGKKGGK